MLLEEFRIVVENALAESGGGGYFRSHACSSRVFLIFVV